MKVYVIINNIYDCIGQKHTSIMLGVYSTYEDAENAQHRYAEQELINIERHGGSTRRYKDYNNSPVVMHLADNKLLIENTFAIEEWEVQ